MTDILKIAFVYNFKQKQDATQSEIVSLPLCLLILISSSLLVVVMVNSKD